MGDVDRKSNISRFQISTVGISEIVTVLINLLLTTYISSGSEVGNYENVINGLKSQQYIFPCIINYIFIQT